MHAYSQITKHASERCNSALRALSTEGGPHLVVSIVRRVHASTSSLLNRAQRQSALLRASPFSVRHARS